ncbi:excalibur calcium-binding domain-containing protein [Gymnodinialimonas mytili]|uniref:excalibur calcium-binding domain-containing protein n=1 Tax=Gymnodinialimonas mytili TaxID=3126503 RepID=UPI003F6FC6AF
MRVLACLVASIGFLLISVLPGDASEESEQKPQTVEQRLIELAQSYSCTPRRYCSRNISSCQEARWYFLNCSWGGALDGDNDGIPCENLC